MTANFAHLSKLEPGPNTAIMTLHMLEGSPRLQMRHAGQSNKPYMNAVARENAKNGATRRIQQGRMDNALAEQLRDQDRNLLPKHVVTGWEGVLDTSGKPVPYSQENAAAFFAALPAWIIDEIRNFAGYAGNFLPDAPEPEQIADQAKL